MKHGKFLKHYNPRCINFIVKKKNMEHSCFGGVTKLSTLKNSIYRNFLLANKQTFQQIKASYLHLNAHQVKAIICRFLKILNCNKACLRQTSKRCMC